MNDSAKRLIEELPRNVQLIVVSKTRTVEEIVDVYSHGIRDFGENKVQEMIAKQPQLPQDIRWHLIGHLQTNKVKFIAPFISLIHSVDSLKLLKEIDAQGKKHNRIIDCLLQIYIASEETKFGLSFNETISLLSAPEIKTFHNIRITGLMGMASFTTDINLVRRELKSLRDFFIEIKSKFFNLEGSFKELSMGMSSDYNIAIEEGSTMIRVGTAIFGERTTKR